MALPRQTPSSSFFRSVTFIKPAPSRRDLAWPSVKLLAPFSRAEAATMFAVPDGLTVDGALPVVLTAGLDEPVGPPVPRGGWGGLSYSRAGAEERKHSKYGQRTLHGNPP